MSRLSPLMLALALSPWTALVTARSDAAGDPCTKWQQRPAATQSLMNVCSSNDARRSGREVVKRYLEQRETLAGGRRSALDKSQRAWATYRDTYCAERGAAYSGGSMQPLVINTCVDLLNRRRALDLSNDHNDH